MVLRKEDRVEVVIFRYRNGENLKHRVMFLWHVAIQVWQGFGGAGRRVEEFGLTSSWFSLINQNDQMKIAVFRIVIVWLQKLGMKKLGTCCCPECCVCLIVCFVLFFPQIGISQHLLAKRKCIRPVHNSSTWEVCKGDSASEVCHSLKQIWVGNRG